MFNTRNRKNHEHERILGGLFNLFIMADMQGKLLTVNKHFEKVMGFTQQELLGQEYISFVHPDDAEFATEYMSKVIQNNSPANPIIRCRTKNGDYLYLEWNVRVLEVALYCSARDVSEIVKARQILRESEEYYRNLFEKHDAPQLLVEPETGTIVDANYAASEYYGWSRDELRKMNIHQISLQDTDTISSLFRRVIGDKNTSCQCRHLLADGSQREVELFFGSVIRNGRTFIQELIIDITEQKEAEKMLKEANEQLIRLNKEKDQFIAILAHDLKSPFQGLLGYTEYLMNADSDEDVQSIRKMSKMLHANVHKVYNLLDELIEWAVLRKGGLNTSSENIVLYKAVESVIELFGKVIKEKQLRILNNTPAETLVFCDKHMLSAVLRNLIHNAVKFTPKTGTVSIEAYPENNHTVVSISDTGIGISKEVAGRIFAFNKEVRRNGTEGEVGTGLGLLHCKEYVEKNGGELKFESVENEGTTFYFSIPTGNVLNYDEQAFA